MVCHVLYKFLKLHKFGNGTAVPLVFGYARLIAFVLLVTYHTFAFKRLFGTIAATKIAAIFGKNPDACRCVLLPSVVGSD